MVRNGKLLGRPIGVILDDEPQGFQHRHNPGSPLVKVLTDALLQDAHVDPAVAAPHAYGFAEAPDRLGGVSPPADSHYGRHARVVPSGDIAILHQLQELALAHDRIGKVKPREFVLPWPVRHRQVVQEPLVKGPVTLKLKGADGMGDSLDGIRLAMGVVIHGIDAPGIPHMGVGGVENPVHDRIAEIHVG